MKGRGRYAWGGVDSTLLRGMGEALRSTPGEVGTLGNASALSTLGACPVALGALCVHGPYSSQVFSHSSGIYTCFFMDLYNDRTDVGGRGYFIWIEKRLSSCPSLLSSDPVLNRVPFAYDRALPFDSNALSLPSMGRALGDTWARHALSWPADGIDAPIRLEAVLYFFRPYQLLRHSPSPVIAAT